MPFDDVIAANQEYAATFDRAGLKGQAARHLAVLTCIDSRIDPLGMLGLRAGDAKILRNAGARVTEEVLGTLVIVKYLLDVERVMVVAHTDCRMAVSGEAEIHEAIRAAGGPDTRDLRFDVAPDQEACLREDVERIRSSPYLAGLEVEGFLYDVETGELSPAGN